MSLCWSIWCMIEVYTHSTQGTQYIGYLRACVSTGSSLNRVRLVDGIIGISVIAFPPAQTQPLPICLQSAACSRLVLSSLLGSHRSFLGMLHCHSLHRSCSFCCFLIACWGWSQSLSFVVLPLGPNPVTAACSLACRFACWGQSQFLLSLTVLPLGQILSLPLVLARCFVWWSRSLLLLSLIMLPLGPNPVVVICHHLSLPAATCYHSLLLVVVCHCCPASSLR